MKVYVAGESVQHRYATEVMDGLENSGHVVTHRWDNSARFFYQNKLAIGIKLTELEAAGIARECLLAIDQSDVFVLLHGIYHGCGSGKWVELGYAFARMKRIVLFVENAGEVETKNCFLFLPGVEVVVGRPGLLQKLKEIKQEVVANESIA